MKTIMYRLIIKKIWNLFPLLLMSQMLLSATGPQAISLDGDWDIIFDEKNIGAEAEWNIPDNYPDEIAEYIKVPDCWELYRKDYEGVGWYRKTFSVDPVLSGKVVKINFGAANYRAEVWINGNILGRHEGGYTPFEFEISDYLNFDKPNTLIVRIIGPLLTREQRIDDIGENEMPHWRAAIAGGLHQSVNLIVADVVYIDDIFVEPMVESSSAVANITLYNSTFNKVSSELLLEVCEGSSSGKVIANKRIPLLLNPGAETLSIEIPIHNAKLWTHKNPNLYTIIGRLVTDGKEKDSYPQRFGMRTVTVKDGDLLLNGERLYMKGIFVEGLYANSLINAPSADFIQKEIEMAKSAGFNTLRFWRKPPLKEMLEMADEMGILVVAGPPIECMGYGPEISPLLKERLLTETRELVQRDRNHPCIIYWEIFNEIERIDLMRLRHEVCLEARKFDPTRLILDESGGTRTEEGRAYLKPLIDYTDKQGSKGMKGTRVYLPYSTKPVRVIDVHRNLGGPYFSQDFEMFSQFGEEDVMSLITECGGGAFPDVTKVLNEYKRTGNPISPDYRTHQILANGLQEVLEGTGLNSAFDSLSDFCLASQEIQAQGNKLYIESLRMNPKLDGYCVHAWTGGGWVLGSGILNIFRQPKLVWENTKLTNSERLIVPRTSQHNYYSGQTVELEVTGVNELQSTTGKLILELIDESRAVLERKEFETSLKSGIQKMAKWKFPAPRKSGEYQVIATYSDISTLKNSTTLFVLNDLSLTVPEMEIATMGPAGELEEFLNQKGIPFEAFNSSKSNVPVFVTISDVHNKQSENDMRKLLKEVNAGRTIVMLRPPADIQTGIWNHSTRKRALVRMEIDNTLLRKNILPVKPMSRSGRGNWIGLFHPVKPHPIFEELPTARMMGQVYQNVFARRTLVELPGDGVAFTVSFDWTHDYIGLSEVWHGKDLSILEHGKGRIIFSNLELIENLGKDPVADKIFFNLIRFVHGK